MQRPPLKSREKMPKQRIDQDNRISVINAHVTAKGKRNWRVILEISGVDTESPDNTAQISPTISNTDFKMERLDGGANLSFIITRAQWLQAPNLIEISLFMDARSSEITEDHLYQHTIRIVHFPGHDINPAAANIPLLLSKKSPHPNTGVSSQDIKTTSIVNYLAKDYETIRDLMISNIERSMPGWQDNTPADIGLMLLEILAYNADYLSYRQDFAANEAYLKTALLRTSLSRHARLLGYFPDEGCAPRTLLTFQVAHPLTISQGTSFLSDHKDLRHRVIERNSDLFERMLIGGSTCFETRLPLDALPELNQLRVHNYDLQEYTLFSGSTSATLELPIRFQHIPIPIKPGNILVFQQSPEMKNYASSIQGHYLRAHAVRVTHVEHTRQEVDKAQKQTLVMVRWDSEDAFPRDMPISTLPTNPGNTLQSLATVFANVVEAEYGLTRSIELSIPTQIQAADWQPQIQATPLHSSPILREAMSPPITHFLNSPSGQLTYPTIQLQEGPLIGTKSEGISQQWVPSRDLLQHDANSRVFMVDENEGDTVKLRFGKNGMGRTPSLGRKYTAHIREAKGSNGAVGSNVLTIAAPVGSEIEQYYTHLLDVNNPLPATPQRARQSNISIQVKAPEMTRQRNVCVTLNDYESRVLTISNVKSAKVRMIEGEPWPYVHIAILSDHGNVDGTLTKRVAMMLEPHRPLGRRVLVSGPQAIPIEIVLNVIPTPSHSEIELAREIEQAIGNTDQLNNQSLFSANKLHFDQVIFASQIMSVVSAIEGIEEPVFLTFKRADQAGPEISEALVFKHDEIPILGAPSNTPEAGRLIIRFEKGVDV